MIKSGAQLAGAIGGGLPRPFSKIEEIALILQKKYCNFRRKCPVCMHLWVKFLFKMQF